MWKAKYKLSTKGSVIFFILFFSGDVCFSTGGGIHNLILSIIGLIGMITACFLIFYACRNLNWHGMSQERLIKN